MADKKPQNDQPTDSLFFSIKGGSPLARSLSKKEIGEHFSEFKSDVKHIYFFPNSQGKGFIKFSSVKVAKQALHTLSGVPISSHSIPVYMSYYKRRKKSTAAVQEKPSYHERVLQPPQETLLVTSQKLIDKPKVKKSPPNSYPDIVQQPPRKRLPNYKLLVAPKARTKLPGNICGNDLLEHFNRIVKTPAHSASISKTNALAYVDYTTKQAAIEARIKVNGTKLLGKCELYVQLEEPLQSHVISAPLQCTKEEAIFLEHHFLEAGTCPLGPDSAVEVVSYNGSIVLCGLQDDLKPAEKSLKDSLLCGLVHSKVSFSCNLEFVKLFEQETLKYNTLGSITCILKETTVKGAGKDNAELVLHIFGRSSRTVEETTDILKKLKPEEKRFSLCPDSKKVLHALEGEFKETTDQLCTSLALTGTNVRILGLRSEDIYNTWTHVRELVEQKEISEEIPVNNFQLKYIHASQASCIDRVRKQASELHVPNLAGSTHHNQQMLKLTAKICDIATLRKMLTEAISKCVEDQVQISCPQRYLSPWKKRWGNLIEKQQGCVGVELEIIHNKDCDTCTITFYLYGGDGAAVQGLKEMISSNENGRAFTEIITTLSPREVQHVQRNVSGICHALEEAHDIVVELDTSPKSHSVTILVAADLDSDGVSAVECSLSNYLQSYSTKQLKFSDNVAGAILLQKKLREIEINHDSVSFSVSHEGGSCILTLQGLGPDISTVEKAIEEQVSQIQRDTITTSQLILTHSIVPVLSYSETISSLVSSLEKDLACSYPTVQSDERLLAKKCIQTTSNHVISIQLHDSEMSQKCPDAILAVRSPEGSLKTNGDTTNHIKAQHCPALLSVEISTTPPPKSTVFVDISDSDVPSQALQAGLTEIHSKSYGVISVTQQHHYSSQYSYCDWLTMVLDSINSYVNQHPDTTIHTVQVEVDPHTKSASKNFLERYVFSEPSVNTQSEVIASEESDEIKWYWEEHGVYQEYDPIATHDLTSAWKCNNQGRCQAVINGNIYIIDFKNMTQTNMSTKFVRTIKSSPKQKPSVVHGQWSYEDDLQKFRPYTSQKSQAIEDMYTGKCPPTTLSINQCEYTIDFERMVQMNTETGRERAIRRQECTNLPVAPEPTTLKVLDPSETIVFSIRGHPDSTLSAKDQISQAIRSQIKTATVPVPSQLSVDAAFFEHVERVLKPFKYIEHTVVNRDKSATSQKLVQVIGEKELVNKAHSKLSSDILQYISTKQDIGAVQYPSEWEPQKKPCEIFTIKRSSNEWKEISSRFKLTIENVKIVEIRRVQNKLLWEKYEQCRKRIRSKNGGIDNEKTLFHGSRSAPAKEIVGCEEGFDMRWSAEGLWGRANYFAEKASYSDSFAYKKSTQTKEMLVARVLVGDSFTSPPDSALRMPPRKASSEDGLLLKYDTVNGVTGGTKVYMTYDNEKAYPAYIIEYKDSSSWHGYPYSVHPQPKPLHRVQPPVPKQPQHQYRIPQQSGMGSTTSHQIPRDESSSNQTNAKCAVM